MKFPIAGQSVRLVATRWWGFPVKVRFWFSVAAALTAVGLSGGSAQAEVLELPAHERSISTPDGWAVTVGHHTESANRVLPLNSVGTTREVFVTNQAYGKLAGSGTALQGVVLKTGYHLGCGMNITDITLGASVSAGISPGIEITPSMPMPTVGANIGPSVSVQPSFSVSLKPGQVVDLPLGEKEVQGPEAFITNRDAHVKIDGCIAPASIRSYAIVAVKSAAADDSVAVYGDPVAL
ncbi:MspA family porin [Nocardia sp. NPDC051750]|uniref:MspA family porin n=1 Tax=Nocardia sp. NPDC051750 TaxID=3364325 RepID=UPI0037A39646